MSSYDDIRKQYQPQHIKLLLIAESPPPQADIQSSRHFYRSDTVRTEDRLFTNTVKALYPQAAQSTEPQIQAQKEVWLQQLKHDGIYMIEALDVSQRHSVTKEQRQQKIQQALPRLLERVAQLANPQTKIILIKSNVFDVATEPLRSAGFIVLNTELVDYPGRFNQPAYREKLQQLVHTHHVLD
jgi:hypothetical protein